MPDWSQASVSENKVREYLLAPNHPTGGAKARFFLSVGYSRADWQRLRDDLLKVARGGETTRSEQTTFGEKFVRDGTLSTPDGHVVTLRTLWITDVGGLVPRFLTAYPA